jgi:hypothetical protein
MPFTELYSTDINQKDSYNTIDIRFKMSRGEWVGRECFIDDVKNLWKCIFKSFCAKIVIILIMCYDSHYYICRNFKIKFNCNKLNQLTVTTTESPHLLIVSSPTEMAFYQNYC